MRRPLIAVLSIGLLAGCGTAGTANGNDNKPVDEHSSEERAPRRGTRHRRRRRWRRLLAWMAFGVFMLTTIGAVWGALYVNSVNLPGDPVTPQASTLFYRDGRTILARVGTENHSDVPLSSVPEGVRHAVLAAEDRDFYGHAGVSVKGILRALIANLEGGHREGASTITQQYVRNAFLTQDVSVHRKTREIALALKIEHKFSKDQILERYLNTIYYGRGAYGIAAAAHAYFGVTSDRLTEAQGAVLASAIKDPYRYDPANDAAAAQQRWNWVVNAEHEAGWLPVVPPYPKVPPAVNAGANGVVIDRVESELAQHGITSQMLHTQGFTVVTTLDATVQKAALDQVKAGLRGQPADLRAALVAIDPKSGAVRAYYGGKQPGFFDDAQAAHPAGATFEPIVLATALNVGLSVDSHWDGSSPRTFPGRLGVPLYNHDDVQCPVCTLRKATVLSLNTPFYAATEKIGAKLVKDFAYRLGVSTVYADQPSLVDVKGDPKPGRTRPDIAIGRYPVSPADLASVYATFADRGVQHDRYFVQSVRSVAGKAIWTAKPRSRQAITAGAAADVCDVLTDALQYGHFSPGRPAAGKPGSQKWGDSAYNQDAWMAGYTPDLATAVWIGKAKPGPLRDSKGRTISGETMPAQLWSNFTRYGLAGRPALTFPPAPHQGYAGSIDTKSEDSQSKLQTNLDGSDPERSHREDPGLPVPSNGPGTTAPVPSKEPGTTAPVPSTTVQPQSKKR